MPFIAGLDLGQAQDFTALVFAQQTRGDRGNEYCVREIRRYELGTSYPKIAANVKETMSDLRVRGSKIVVDYTGVGRPVVDIMKAERIPAVRPVTITSGHDVKYDQESGVWRVPKKELVSTMQILLSSKRLTVVPSLKEAKTLYKELQNFQVKITTSANETFGAWRDGQHDDIVLATALAVWFGEYRGTADTSAIRVPAVGNRNITESAPPGAFGGAG